MMKIKLKFSFFFFDMVSLRRWKRMFLRRIWSITCSQQEQRGMKKRKKRKKKTLSISSLLSQKEKFFIWCLNFHCEGEEDFSPKNRTCGKLHKNVGINLRHNFGLVLKDSVKDKKGRKEKIQIKLKVMRFGTIRRIFPAPGCRNSPRVRKFNLTTSFPSWCAMKAIVDK